MYIRAASYQIFELKTYRSETVDFRAVFVKHLFYTYPHMTFYLHTYPEWGAKCLELVREMSFPVVTAPTVYMF